MYEVIISLDEEPYERILDVDASPSPGRPAKRTGRPENCHTAEPATPGIRGVRFAEDDPVPEDRGEPVSAEFFNRHEDTIVRQVLQEEEQRHAARPCRF